MKSYLLGFITAVSLFLVFLSVKEVEKEIVILKEVETQYIEKEGLFCIGTHYNPCTEQCDSDFLITASGDSINLDSLNSYSYRWIAISHDLKSYFRFGDSVYIQSENKNIEGYWVVKDLMNRRYHRYVDFLVPFNDTLNIGKCAVKILI